MIAVPIFFDKAGPISVTADKQLRDFDWIERKRQKLANWQSDERAVYTVAGKRSIGLSSRSREYLCSFFANFELVTDTY